MMHKKIALCFLAGTLLFHSTGTLALENNIHHTTPASIDTYTLRPDQAQFKINSPDAIVYGKKVTLATPPQIINGRTLLPLRFVGEQLLEASVHYDASTKHIIIRKDNLYVELTVGSKRVQVNGHEVLIDSPPIILNGSTLLPIRFMSETFNLKIDYSSSSKTITIQKPDLTPNTPPIASFKLKEDTYTIGETLEAIIDTFDEDGDPIINQRWAINQNWSKPYDTLETLSTAVTTGNLSISLQIQDKRGLWSKWHTEQITLTPNMPPTITTFEPKQKAYGQGEVVDFAYDYTNEDFESIKNQRWSYRHTSEKPSQAIYEKPRAFFAEGSYIVTLELQDDAGKWSQKKETTVKVTDKVVDTELNYLFTHGKPGDILANFQRTNFRSYKDLSYTETDVPGTLVMSNSPETIKKDGILYQDYIQGSGRVMFHHIHDMNTSKSKKLVVLVENQGTQPIEGRIINQVVKGPSTDVLFVGQQLLEDYLNMANNTTSLILKPGEPKVIYDSSSRNWTRGQALSGMFEFYFYDQVKLTVVAMDTDAPLSSIGNLGYPERDVHPRGTFDVIDKRLFIDLKGQKFPSKIVIGDGPNEWLIGTDGITGEETANKGNFAVEYHITVEAEEDTAVILNPRGNMYKGAIKWYGEPAFPTPNQSFFPDEKRAAFLGIIPKGTSKSFTYVLPNGSSAPVLIGFIPKSQWK